MWFQGPFHAVHGGSGTVPGCFGDDPGPLKAVPEIFPGCSGTILDCSWGVVGRCRVFRDRFRLFWDRSGVLLDLH